MTALDAVNRRVGRDSDFYAGAGRASGDSMRGAGILDGDLLINEAKALGFKMGDPHFKVKPQIIRHRVAVFSSNHTLYGDMSQRVVQTLEQLAPTVEVYSIDEAFLELSGLRHPSLTFRVGVRLSPHS